MAEPAPSGNFMTHKLGPLPIWAWIAIAGVGIYLYRKSQGGGSTGATQASALAAAQQAAASTTPATAVPTETVSYPGGGSYSGPAGFAPPGIAGTTPGGGNSALSSQTQLGGGYYPGNSSPVTDASGASYQWVANAQTASEELAAGQQLYYEPVPGQFLPSSWQNTPNNPQRGTPQFVRTS